MVYKPPKVNRGGFGPSGVANVSLSPDKKRAKVRFLDGEDDTTYTVDTKKKDNAHAGRWFVQLSGDKKSIAAMRPAEGVYTVKVSKFPAKEGEKPTPKLDKFENPKFSVLLEVLGGEEAGMEIPVNFNYWFEPVIENYEGKDRTVVGYSYHPKSKHMPLLTDFCDLAGVWRNGALPWRDNILPMLQKRCLDANATFKVVIKNGWVDSFLGSSGALADPEPEEEFE